MESLRIPNAWTSVICADNSADTLSPLWAERSPPLELTQVPELTNPPEKLAQILQWSLSRYPPRCQDLPKRRPASPAQEDTQSPIAENLPSTGSKNDLITITLCKIAALRHHKQQSGTTKLAKKIAAEPTLECTSCFDDLPESSLIRLKCTHYYCKPCLATLVMTAIHNESAYPPKCCLTEIPSATIIIPLDQKQRDTYKSKAAEYSIPTDKRWYCPEASCAKWIPPSKLRSNSHKCPHCSTKVCMQCRGKSHARNAECPQDQGLEATINVAEAHGWRRCYKCRTMVERTMGCRHITCSCGGQFCYVCGARWRTCQCTEVDEAARQARLERQRAAYAARDQNEDEEMERALAVIRAIEAREAEERQRREQEQEAARREEEEQLALLEQERQQDERRRRQEAEALERELRETLELSIRLENENLVQALTDTIHHQHVSLDDHQGQQEQTLVSSYKDFKTEHASRETKLAANIATALEKKLAIINATHDAALQKLAMEHEAQEDDLFMQIQVHLRGKPNKEAREQRMQEELLRQHRTEEASLEEALDRDVKEARDSADQETELLRRAMIIKLERARTQFHHDMARLVAKVAAERKWFFVVSERRVLMATEHTRIVYEELKKGVEPVGLSEDMASAIQPLPSLQVLPTELESYSSLQHTPVELEAPSSFSSDNRGPPSSGSSYTTTSNYSFVSVEECKADNTTTPATPAVSIPIIRRPMPRNPTPPSPSFPRNGPAFVATKPGESSKPVKFTHIPDVARPPTPPDTPYQRSPLMPSRWPLPEASPYTTNPRTLPPPLAAAQPYAPTTKPTRSAAPEPHAWSYYNPLPPSKSKTQDKGKTKDKAKKIETPIPPSQAWNVTPSISSDGSSSLSLASGPEAKARKASRWPFRSKKLTDEEIKDRLRNLKIGDAL